VVVAEFSRQGDPAIPPGLRATGQGMLVAIPFGLGGLVGYVGGGAGYELLGGHRLVAAAAVRLPRRPGTAPPVVQSQSTGVR
jgi:hypothetical protein